MTAPTNSASCKNRDGERVIPERVLREWIAAERLTPYTGKRRLYEMGRRGAAESLAALLDALVERPLAPDLDDEDHSDDGVLDRRGDPDDHYRYREALSLIAQHAALDVSERGIAEAARYHAIATAALESQ